MKSLIAVMFFLTFTLIFIKEASAYIDPGTGSMVVQAVIAAVAAVSVSIGIFWRRLKNLFHRLFRGGSDRKNLDES